MGFLSHFKVIGMELYGFGAMDYGAKSTEV
jgi:hypothetical protein